MSLDDFGHDKPITREQYMRALDEVLMDCETGDEPASTAAYLFATKQRLDYYAEKSIPVKFYLNDVSKIATFYVIN